MTRPNCTACTAATVETMRALYDQISSQQTTIMLHGYDVRALAGLLEVLSDEGYSNALAAKDEDMTRWWAQAQYIANQLDKASAGIVAAGNAIEEIGHSLYHAVADDRQPGASIHSKVRGTQQPESAARAMISGGDQ
jgi:hypothetical protein